MNKKYYKIIPYIAFVVLIGLAIWLGVNTNGWRLQAKDWFGDLDKKTVATVKKTEPITAPNIPSINFETYTLEIEINTTVENTSESITEVTNVLNSEPDTETISGPLSESEENTTANITGSIMGYFTISNSWEGHYIYDLAVENTNSTAVASWEINVTLPAGCSLVNFWCCKCVLNGNVLTITPEDYNQNISSGGRITGLGITIASTSQLENMTVNANGDVVSGQEETTTIKPIETKPYEPPVSEGGTPLSNHGKLSLNGTKLVDKNGNPFQLKGVSTHGIGWFPQYVNKEAFKTLRDDWGANTVRLAMYTAEYNGYCTGGSQSDLKQLVENGVSYATDLGMYVIIDWHVLTDCNPNTYKAQAIAFFGEMAAKYCDYDNVIYEICNEPNGGVDWNTIKIYADDVISTIRKYDSDAIILVGTPTWSQDIDQVAANPVSNGFNVMYTLHFYAATHKDNIRNKLITALNSGTPAFISEFSICDASGNGGIDYTSANEWKNLINQYNLSYAGWSLSNKAETSALIKSECNKLYGWSTEDLSQTGIWLRNMISGN